MVRLGTAAAGDVQGRGAAPQARRRGGQRLCPRRRLRAGAGRRLPRAGRAGQGRRPRDHRSASSRARAARSGSPAWSGRPGPRTSSSPAVMSLPTRRWPSASPTGSSRTPRSTRGAVAMAARFVTGPAIALRAAKQAIDDGLELDLDAALGWSPPCSPGCSRPEDQRPACSRSSSRARARRSSPAGDPRPVRGGPLGRCRRYRRVTSGARGGGRSSCTALAWPSTSRRRTARRADPVRAPVGRCARRTTHPEVGAPREHRRTGQAGPRHLGRAQARPTPTRRSIARRSTSS